jgi:hypothetical protein
MSSAMTFRESTTKGEVTAECAAKALADFDSDSDLSTSAGSVRRADMSESELVQPRGTSRCRSRSRNLRGRVIEQTWSI